MDFALITIVVQLIFLEGVLSIDNAAVLGAMVTPLPDTIPVPWPRMLQGIGHRLDPWLGTQRTAALKVGLLGAYLGRGLMLALASYVIRNPWLRLVGAFYLVYLALNHFGDLGTAGEETDHTSHLAAGKTSFWSIVLSLELADLAFSLDNVIAAVALSDRYWIILLGVALGIVTMRFAAGIFTRMIEWEPSLQHAAFLLILAIAIELLLDDLFHIHLHEMAQFAISFTILLLTIGFARISWLRPFNVLWSPLLRLSMLLQIPLRWITWPIRTLVRLIANRKSSQAVSGEG
jgi:tellurite resistance protein TerC